MRDNKTITQVDFFDLPVEVEEVDELGHSMGRQSVQIQSSYSPSKTKTQKRHKWAFFLAFMFAGLFMAEFTGVMALENVGLAIGFLFFVNPVYDKAVNLLGLD